jgi:hypothetical protein
VEVKETGCRQREVFQSSNCVAGDFEALADQASPNPTATTLLYVWPHETLCDQPRCSFGAWFREIVDALDHLEPQGSWNVRPSFPGRSVAVGDRGAGNLLLLEPKGGD